MKKLGKLTINPEKVIKNEKLMNLRGGEINYFSCYCGFVGGYYESFPFIVGAENLTAALQQAGITCYGMGATCSGT